MKDAIILVLILWHPVGANFQRDGLPTFNAICRAESNKLLVLYDIAYLDVSRISVAAVRHHKASKLSYALVVKKYSWLCRMSSITVL